MSIALGLRSWYSGAGGFLSPRDAVTAARDAGATTVGWADRSDMAGYAEFLDACESYSMVPMPGIEVNLEWEETVRPCLLFARDAAGVSKLLAAVDQMDLDSGGLRATPADADWEGLLFFSPGRSSHLIDLAVRRDLVGVQRFSAAVNHTGARHLIGIDPTPFTPYGLKALERCFPVDAPVVPYRPLIYPLERRAEYEAVRAVLSHKAPESGGDCSIATCQQMLSASVGSRSFPFMPKWSALLTRSARKSVFDAFAAAGEPGRFGFRGSTNCGPELRRRCLQQLKVLELDREPYTSRVEEEAHVAAALQLEPLLLHLGEFVTDLKARGCPVGPGRGSSVNSLLCYLLGITQVDPVEAGLPYERFLNVDRADHPDVDIDVSKACHREAVALFSERFQGACRIRNFVRPTTLSCLRGGLSVAGVSDKRIDSVVAEMRRIAPGFEECSPTAFVATDAFSQLRLLIGNEDTAQKLKRTLVAIGDDRPVGSTVRVGSVAIAPRPVSELTPVQPFLDKGQIVRAVAAPFPQAECRGVLKVDILPSDALDLSDRINRRLSKTNRAPIASDGTGLTAPICRTLFDRGYVTGLFQLGKQSAFIASQSVRSFDDLVYVLGLIRLQNDGGSVTKAPGILDRLPAELKAVYSQQTAKTRGIVVFQEQVTLLLHALSDLSLADSEAIRYALSKKRPVPLALAKKWRESCSEKFSISLEESECLLGEICGSGYKFNLGHSRSYAQISAQFAIAKVQHPGVFFCEVLRHSRSDISREEFARLQRALAFESTGLGCKILGLDFSKSLFTVEEDVGTVRLGIDSLPKLHAGQLKALKALPAGSSGVREVASIVGEEAAVSLVALGAWDAFEKDSAKLICEISPANRGRSFASPDALLTQIRTFGFLTHDKHPGIPAVERGVVPCFGIGQHGMDAVKKEFVTTGFLADVGLPQRNARGYTVTLFLTGWLGDRPVRVSRFFEEIDTAEEYCQQHKSVGQVTPVTLQIRTRPSGDGRFFLNTESAAVPCLPAVVSSSQPQVLDISRFEAEIHRAEACTIG